MIELAQQTQDAYSVLCDRFQDATGWPVTFARLQDESVVDVESNLLERGEYCWWQRIDDGIRCVGLLILNLPDQTTSQGSVESIIGLAQSIALLMSQQAKSERALSEQSQSLQVFSKLCLEPQANSSLGKNLCELLSAAVRLSGYQSASFYLLNPGT
ncbi:MAG: hypothetical protein JWM11_2391, partial [Planctomycetaceae bacterium]|nr:hypothetical protein [Planctomycetaceae bacterium]